MALSSRDIAEAAAQKSRSGGGGNWSNSRLPQGNGRSGGGKTAPRRPTGGGTKSRVGGDVNWEKPGDYMPGFPKKTYNPPSKPATSGKGTPVPGTPYYHTKQMQVNPRAQLDTSQVQDRRKKITSAVPYRPVSNYSGVDTDAYRRYRQGK
jgi:hypothetical protein